MGEDGNPKLFQSETYAALNWPWSMKWLLRLHLRGCPFSQGLGRIYYPHDHLSGLGVIAHLITAYLWSVGKEEEGGSR